MGDELTRRQEAQLPPRSAVQASARSRHDALRRARRIVVMLALGVTALGFAAWHLGLIDRVRTEVEAAVKAHQKARLLAALKARVQTAELDAMTAVALRSYELENWIIERKQGAEPFAKKVLSMASHFRGIWALRTDSTRAEYQGYIRKQFDSYVFSEAELGEAVKRSVDLALKDLDAIENRLAVAIRAEVQQAPFNASRADFEIESFKRQVVDLSRQSSTNDLGRMMMSELATYVGTQVFARLGVAAGVLSAGAASSWWTVGAGVVLGLAIDLVWNWLADPKAELQKKIEQKLDDLSLQAGMALKQQLEQVVAERSAKWKKIVDQEFSQ